MKRVFLTGGAGFIGHHVSKELLAHNIEPVSYDAFDPAPGTRLDGVEYLKGDVLDARAMSRAMKGCDGVMHLAAVLGVKRATEELLTCLDVNIIGTIRAFEAALFADIETVLVTSSSEVFGDSQKEPYHETSPFNPKSAYAVTKLAGEEYALGFHREYGMTYKTVRFFNVYGAGQSPTFVMSIFADRLVKGQKMRVYGDGAQVRAFCNVRDAAKGTVLAFTNDVANNRAFHIGNDSEPTTMLDLAKTFARLEGKGDEMIERVGFEQSDRTKEREIYLRVPDVSAAKEHLGYEPEVSLEQGVQEMIDYARANPA